MNFRETIPADFEFMSHHSINKDVDRKILDCVDYVFTLEDDVPLAIGGFRMINTTTAWCWIDLSDEAGKHLVKVYRVIKEWIDEFAESHKIKRLQAFVRTDFEEAERLVKHLGFKKESIMENFFGEENAYLYVRLT